MGCPQEAAQRARNYAAEAMGGMAEVERQRVERARKIERFCSQPFYAAEPFTGVPGRSVPREETVRVCRNILAGHYDDTPEEAFRFIGGEDEIGASGASRLWIPGTG